MKGDFTANAARVCALRALVGHPQIRRRSERQRRAPDAAPVIAERSGRVAARNGATGPTPPEAGQPPTDGPSRPTNAPQQPQNRGQSRSAGQPDPKNAMRTTCEISAKGGPKDRGGWVIHPRRYLGGGLGEEAG